MGKYRGEARRKKRKHPILSWLTGTVFYFALATILLFALDYTQGVTEEEAVLFACIVIFLYLIVMAVRGVRKRLTRKRMAGRLSQAKRRNELPETEFNTEHGTAFGNAEHWDDSRYTYDSATLEIMRREAEKGRSDRYAPERESSSIRYTSRHESDSIRYAPERDGAWQEAAACEPALQDAAQKPGQPQPSFPHAAAADSFTDFSAKSAFRPAGTNRSSKKKTAAAKRFALPGFAALLVVIAIFWFVQSSNRIPDSLLELKERYPETTDFVNNYPRNKHKKHTIDLSGEVTAGEIPLFLQWDERWGYETYGSSFLAVTGCGPTCLSMVTCGLTGDTYWNPLETARFSEQQGYYVPGEGTAWDLMTEGAWSLGLNASYGEVSADFIYNHLSPSHPMICSMYPGDFTYTGHFIVLTGFDSDGNLIVNDPNSRINSEKRWSLDTVLPQIRSLWLYSVS